LLVPLDGQNALFGLFVEVDRFSHDRCKSDSIAMLVQVVRRNARNHDLGRSGCLQVNFSTERFDDRYFGVEFLASVRGIRDGEVFRPDTEIHALARHTA